MYDTDVVVMWYTQSQEELTNTQNAASEISLNLPPAEQNTSSIPNDLPLFGIEDGVFQQSEDRPGLMTKREIRVQILSELELPHEGIFWDIGAGVGTIGLEALRIRPKLKLLLVFLKKIHRK